MSINPKTPYQNYGHPKPKKNNVPPAQSYDNKIELQRMISNDFLEAKSVMYVFDEILQNSTDLSDLESKLN